MSEKRYIHIRNWDKFQHRDTTRNQKSGAPWIKDYVGQLHDADWQDLTCTQRGILQALRLMYAASRGRGVSQQQARAFLTSNAGEASHWGRNLKALNHAGFIEFSDSKLTADPLASRQQSASPDVEEDVDVERDVEEKKNTGAVTQLDHKRQVRDGTAPTEQDIQNLVGQTAAALGEF